MIWRQAYCSFGFEMVLRPEINFLGISQNSMPLNRISVHVLRHLANVASNQQDGNVPSRRHILGSKIFKEQILEIFGKKITNLFQNCQ